MLEAALDVLPVLQKNCFGGLVGRDEEKLNPLTGFLYLVRASVRMAQMS